MRGTAEIRFVGPPGWRRMPPLTRLTLVLAAAGYLAALIWPPLLAWIALSPGAVVQELQLWRLVTYPLGIVGIFSILFDLLLLWSFGTELEAVWGARRYALFLLACTLVAAAVGLFVSIVLARSAGNALGFAGFGGVITAMIVAWALRGPGLPANLFGVLPMTRAGFAILALVIVVFGELEQRALGRLLYLLGGLPVAWWFTRGGRRPGGMVLRPPRFFRRSRFRVVRGGPDYPIH